jgi:simple sugar transport system permease protein
MGKEPCVNRSAAGLIVPKSSNRAGAAGLIICSNVRSADANNAGLNTELDAILAAVIGGTSMSGGKFSLAGSLVGALLIQTLTTTIYAFGVPPEVSLVVKSLVVVLVCFFQSSMFGGVFAKAGAKGMNGGASKNAAVKAGAQV